jgi:hypothetical protein
VKEGGVVKGRVVKGRRGEEVKWRKGEEVRGRVGVGEKVRKVGIIGCGEFRFKDLCRLTVQKIKQCPVFTLNSVLQII